MPSPHIHVYLGQKLKDAWQAHCELTGEKPGVALRRLLEERVRAAVGPSAAPAVRKRDRGVRSRLELRLTEAERTWIQQQADREGCSPQAWVVGLVRTRCALPHVARKEAAALDESNYQLLAIGRNLNQIAKRLNEGSPENVTVKEIRALREQIDAHTEVVSNLLNANAARWTRGPRGKGGGVAVKDDDGEAT